MKKLIFILPMLIISVCIFAQNETQPLSKSRYSDPNGFFKIVPPEEWQVQKYPQDPRGKVAFIGPEKVELRILAKILDKYSYEQMFKEIKGQEKQLGINTNIEKIIFSGVPAIKRNFIIKGIKILFIDFMVENNQHNLMYSAAPEKFNKYLEIAKLSFDTYQPILKSASSQEILEQTIAKSVRLSQIFYEQGNYELSLEYIKEGMSIDSTNIELIKLKKKIEPRMDSIQQKTNDKIGGNESNSSDDDMGPIFFMILSMGGAVVILFRKNIASGTSAPGFASLTTPVIGIVMLLYGIVELFDRGSIFLGIVTCLLSLLILISPFLLEIYKEKNKR